MTKSWQVVSQGEAFVLNKKLIIINVTYHLHSACPSIISVDLWHRFVVSFIGSYDVRVTSPSGTLTLSSSWRGPKQYPIRSTLLLYSWHTAFSAIPSLICTLRMMSSFLTFLIFMALGVLIPVHCHKSRFEPPSVCQVTF